MMSLEQYELYLALEPWKTSQQRAQERYKKSEKGMAARKRARQRYKAKQRLKKSMQPE